MKIEFFSLVTLVVFVANPAMCDDKTKWVEHPNIKADAKTKQWNIRFELNRATDVEVAIVDATTSKVVRHLAAGVLGGNAPDPLQSGTLVQTISWDGRDDYGNPVADASKLVVRVRTGMDVVLDTIVGGVGWYYPFDDTLGYFIIVPATQPHWLLSFILHWTFTLELSIWALALVCWMRHWRTREISFA